MGTVCGKKSTQELESYAIPAVAPGFSSPDVDSGDATPGGGDQVNGREFDRLSLEEDSTGEVRQRLYDSVTLDEESILPPKHNVFLSHSGAQKPFVQYLFHDLERMGHSTFYDADRESLPKGEKFAKLILDAARQCYVAVVVLSYEYVTSKWPMLELATFVEAQRSSNRNLRIYPLFYNLEVDELKNTKLQNEMLKNWKKIAAEDKRIDLKIWMDAIHVLCGTNGEVFTQYGGSELAFRQAAVHNISEMVKPYILYDVSAMEGRDRLCNILADTLKKTRATMVM